ncbi:hypothetical protein M2352_000223 [Azospirillum fermentarium]|uniref:helix-turn-helix domain-containing protein n=1 Tax=Azospirillum fermentarium TaxID=1233114 RepID=UPI0022266C03|nr:helix-turn-helix domain-containing protein [Azospirillum fermentarium]MCW2244632.1 hypothetical protein [Azospirillum fermentarium]
MAVAVAAVLARFHNSQTGLTCPSLDSITRLAGFCERSVRKAIAALIRAGLLIVTRRRAQTSLYSLRLKAAPGAGSDNRGIAPEALSADDEWHPVLAVPAPSAAKQGKEPLPTGRVGVSTEPADLEAERLARRIQQASSTPWRLDNARRDTLEAIRRAGIDAVHAEAERLRGAGLAAWQVRQRLEALTAPPLLPMRPSRRPSR